MENKRYQCDECIKTFNEEPNIIGNSEEPIIMCNECYNKEYGVHTPDFSDELKVNPKDNTITIKKVKDSWSRDEVRHLMTQSYLRGIDRELDDFNKLIEENL